MSRYKIVIGVTGSIASYKSCDLVSKLVQKGHQVKVLMTPHAEKFVGVTSLKTLSKNPVYTDDFQDPVMNHIELGRWCDGTLIYPTTAQTINKLACGVGHDPLTAFFLAYDFTKPFMIAPAMNTRMLENPVTQKSINFLKQVGCETLPSEKGSLACGEIGEGRLLSPDQTMIHLFNRLTGGFQPKRILITAGGTRETIDGVRTLTNLSTGQTGASLADFLHDKGHKVLLLTSSSANKPTSKIKVDTYNSFNDIYNTLKALGRTHHFDMILHSAAISDYSIGEIQTPEGHFSPGTYKISSKHPNISLKLERNKKILPYLKDLFGTKPIVVGFKLTSTENQEEQAKAILNLFSQNTVDYVIHNDMNNINQGKRQFLMTSKMGEQKDLPSISALAEHIANILDSSPADSQESQKISDSVNPHPPPIHHTEKGFLS